MIPRSITAFEQQGASGFFGEPEFDTADLLRAAPDGRGPVSVLELPAVQELGREITRSLFGTARRRR